MIPADRRLAQAEEQPHEQAAWYRGLALAGIARGGRVQQLQALLTLGWSALVLGERVTLATVLAALAVIASVVWSQRGRTPTVVAPEE
jgi:drug/metabolite transporter (DMT)-like permease